MPRRVEESFWAGKADVSLGEREAPRIHAALSEIRERGGGTLRLDAGRFELDRTLILPSGTRVVGAGPETVLRLAKGANCHMMTNADHKSGDSVIHISSLRLEGQMEHQSKPDHVKTLTFACGIYLKNVKQILVSGVSAREIRQTALHLNECEAAMIEGLDASELGWSGLSSSEASDIFARGTVRRAGLDQIHSAVHVDGGEGVELDFEVADTTGNGIMIDSAYSPMSTVLIRGSATRCKRGVSFSGDAENGLSNALVSGSYCGNREVGIMVSNASGVVIHDCDIADNGEVGILFQGRAGGRRCIVSNVRITGNPVDMEERHESGANLIASELREGLTGRIASAFRARSTASRSGTQLAHAAGPESPDPPVPVADRPASAGYGGLCTSCGAESLFENTHSAVRESFRCILCKASARHRAQAAAIVEQFGRGRVRSLPELVETDWFRDLGLYEPGIIGPNREIFARLPHYQVSYFWDDIPRGAERDGVRNEDLMDLSFRDNAFDLIVSSDIMEHVRHPWRAFREIRRVLRPGGKHIFSIPVLEPLMSKSRYRVDTSGEEDIHIDPPHYHIAGDGSRSLVYTEFGSDMFAELARIGTPTIATKFDHADPALSRVLTFVSTRT